jgi:hypothetical protein
LVKQAYYHHHHHHASVSCAPKEDTRRPSWPNRLIIIVDPHHDHHSSSSSRTPEEGAHSPSWPNRLIIIVDHHHDHHASSSSRTPEEGAHSPTWPNGLLIIIIVIVLICAGTHLCAVQAGLVEDESENMIALIELGRPVGGPGDHRAQGGVREAEHCELIHPNRNMYERVSGR